MQNIIFSGSLSALISICLPKNFILFFSRFRHARLVGAYTFPSAFVATSQWVKTAPMVNSHKNLNILNFNPLSNPLMIRRCVLLVSNSIFKMNLQMKRLQKSNIFYGPSNYRRNLNRRISIAMKILNRIC